jgi:hypothetical protein
MYWLTSHLLYFLNQPTNQVKGAESSLGSQYSRRYQTIPFLMDIVYKGPPLVPILSMTNQVHIFPTPFFNIHSNTISGLTSGLLASGFPTEIFYAFLNKPMRDTCSVNLSFLGLITLKTLGQQYKLRSSSLCSLLQPPATSFLLGPNILNNLFSPTLNPHSSNSVRDHVPHPYKTTRKIMVCIF